MNDSPRQGALSVLDAVAISVGVVIGAGIFKTPALVATFAGGTSTALILWLAGGLVTLVGALCYAELTSTYPHAGGDYHYLLRSYGGSLAFLFVWARMTVIQTGSIAMWAFLIGDYLTEILPLGAYSTSFYAMLTITALTALNIAGIRPGVGFQKVLLAAIIIGLLLVAAAGSSAAPTAPSTGGGGFPSAAALGSAMIFVLLTYGGWNEAAYLSGEVRDPGRNMFRVLFLSITVITVLYLIVNYAFLRCLGIEGVAGSDVVAADMMRRVFGDKGAAFISLLISIAALSSMNGVIITSARTTYALGRDYSFMKFLGGWNEKSGTPVNALILLGALSLALVVFGTGTRSGFEMMVEYTAPVFWLFFLLVGISLMILRYKDPLRERPFRVPLYPLTPILFCLFCAFMLHSSIAYTGKGALLGVAVLVAGIPLLLFKGAPVEGD